MPLGGNEVKILPSPLSTYLPNNGDHVYPNVPSLTSLANNVLNYWSKKGLKIRSKRHRNWC